MSRPGPPPISPLSMSSNESGLLGRYENLGRSQGGGSADRVPLLAGTPNDVPYRGGPYDGARPTGSSPHSSNHPSGSTDMSRPSVSGSNGRPPSSASSFAMSNDGRMAGMPHTRESSRSQFRDPGEDALQRHYAALKAYLAMNLQDEKGNMKPNRARDKLLRLSVTQFMELSTDVYDELIRREDERTQRVENVPRFLLPKNNFHPKRNQARQKLSTLPIERFRQLATDVFYELERRIPRLGNASRPMSNMSDVSTRSGRPGMRPPPGNFPPGQRGPYGGPPAVGGRRPSEAGSLGRPLPKQFQSNTIVPNKSTMVEDDDMEDDEDAYGIDRRQGSSEEDQEKIRAQEAEIAELKSRLEADSRRSPGIEEERNQWATLREELEQKHVDAQLLVEQLTSELSSLKLRHSSDTESHAVKLRELESANSTHTSRISQLESDFSALSKERDSLVSQIAAHDAPPTDYEARLKTLTQSLTKQESITQDVQAQAMQYLREMRTLSNQNDAAIEKEEKLAAQISKLEQENDQWRQRYSKLKAQNKHLRASTMGLGLQGGGGLDAAGLVRQEGLIDASGRIKDVQVTAFQVAMEELLRVARGSSTAQMLDCVKGVVVGVQAITSSAASTAESATSKDPPELPRLQARVTGTANSLITATKQHAASHGLSPVALLDAAASNLTAAVVELIKAVRIRPTSQSEPENGTDGGLLHVASVSREVPQDPETDDESRYGRDSYGLEQVGDDHLAFQVPQQSASSTHQQGSHLQENGHHHHDHPQDSALAAGAKKGWFGWAGKWNDDSPTSSPSIGAFSPPMATDEDRFPIRHDQHHYPTGAVRTEMNGSNGLVNGHGYEGHQGGDGQARKVVGGQQEQGQGMHQDGYGNVGGGRHQDAYHGYEYDSGSDYDPYR